MEKWTTDQPCCSQPRIATAECKEQKVDALIKEDWRVTVGEIAL
jgi:hypothetical protein